MTHAKQVVIVEDDFLIAEYLAQLCKGFGATVVGRAADADAAREVIDRSGATHILMDYRLAGVQDGVDVALWAHETHPTAKVVFVIGSNEPATLERIRSDHPHRILIKPIAPNQLRAALS